MLLAFIVVLVLALTNSQTTTSAVVFNRTYHDVPVAFVMVYSFAFGALCVGIFTRCRKSSSGPVSIARRKRKRR